MSNTIVTIHQPNFIPWIGFFYKISKSDIYVILDDVEFTKNSFINRNKIKTPQGEQWLTVPVKYSGNSDAKINEISLSLNEKGTKKLLRTLEMNYKKAPYFNDFFESFSDIFKEGVATNNLAKLNIGLIKWAINILDLSPKIQLSSELNVEGSSTKRLINICKSLNGTIYYSGFGGNNYQSIDDFNENEIEVKTTSFEHPTYNQIWGDFKSHLSILDFIFNEGEKAKDFFAK